MIKGGKVLSKESESSATGESGYTSDSDDDEKDEESSDEVKGPFTLHKEISLWPVYTSGRLFKGPFTRKKVCIKLNPLKLFQDSDFDMEDSYKNLKKQKTGKKEKEGFEVVTEAEAEAKMAEEQAKSKVINGFFHVLKGKVEKLSFCFL